MRIILSYYEIERVQHIQETEHLASTIRMCTSSGDRRAFAATLMEGKKLRCVVTSMGKVGGGHNQDVGGCRRRSYS